MADRATLLALADILDRWSIPEPNSGCYLWMRAAHQKGYGTFWLGKERWSSHRAAYTVSRGIIPAGMLVCHHCDNPPCCNPDHLFLGSVRDNAVDMVRKARHPVVRDASRMHALQRAGGKAVGARNLYAKGHHPSAKVTDADVIQIRADNRPDHIIAADFGISRASVSAIQTRRTWSHIQ